MNFQDKATKESYFDMVIDEYKNNNFEFVEHLIENLSAKEQRSLLLYFFKYTDNISLYMYASDIIFA